jgi:SAM-dependent methyltransferase/uncharacterized coiled-coil protein SlyX
MNEPDETPTTPEARVVALLADSFGHARRGGPGRLIRRLADRATLAVRHRQYHVDIALLQAVHEVERRRASEMATLRNDVRTAFESLDAMTTRFDDVETRAAVAAALADEIAQVVHAVSGRLTQTMAELADGLTGQRVDVEKLREELDRTTVELARTTAQLTREIAGLRAVAGKAEFAFAEMTARPFVSDANVLRTTDAQGHETLGFRDGPRPQSWYAGFEQLFRGPEELVCERQRPYVELLAPFAPVVDLGCGRGELLQLLAVAGTDAQGVDLDADMVERCRARGLDVELGDAVAWLEKHADHSLGAVFSAQFVEHIGTEDLVRLLRVALDKLRPGGLLVAETVNPHSPRALKSFWVDPTHVRPLFPETLLALCRLAGYAEAATTFPTGTHDLADNLRTQGEYAVVARTPE